MAPKRAIPRQRRVCFPPEGCTLSSLGYEATMTKDDFEKCALGAGMRVFPSSDLIRSALPPPTAPVPQTSGVNLSDAIIIKPTSTGTFKLMKPAPKKRPAIKGKKVATTRKKVPAKKKTNPRARRSVNKKVTKKTTKKVAKKPTKKQVGKQPRSSSTRHQAMPPRAIPWYGGTGHTRNDWWNIHETDW